MGNQYSDHNKPFTNLVDYLPEVFRSDVNQTVLDTSFNRHLTADDTARVAGYIGEKNTNALVDRQIKESTPHRQAYQLAPTMVAKVGTIETALSYKAFQAQLTLMGIDIGRLPLWANTMQFNWAPPTNIDMLVNYQDYFWSPINPQSPAQYMTIENRCNKATSKVRSYQQILIQRGSSFAINLIDYANNSVIIDGLQSDLFVEGFVFFTHSTEQNFKDKFWTVQSSTYDLTTNETTLELVEPIATVSATAPIPVRVGQWWFDTQINLLKAWDGAAWVLTVQQPIVSISLAELGQIYQTDANCACNQDYGWDIAQWDDNQITPADVALWNAPLLALVTWATEAEWVTENGAPNAGDSAQPKIWYDTTTNELKEYNFDTADWRLVVGNFSTIVAKTTGNARWDLTVGCEPQTINQWSEQNQWIHKTEVSLHPNARRAQLPILEYNSTTELNSWSKRNLVWKYRATVDAAFSIDAVGPSRYELEPIKGFATTNISGSWYIYLHNNASDINRNIDYTDVLPVGTRIRISDDGVLSEVYAVASAEYREVLSSDPMAATIGSDFMCTVVRLEGTIYTAPLTSGGPLNTRIQPVVTGHGDTWLGYHIHWVLDEVNTTTVANATVSSDLYKVRDATTVIAATSTPGNMPDYNSVTIGRTYQELVALSTTLTTIVLQPALTYGSSTGLYAVPDSDEIRVYINGIRTYGTYSEQTAIVLPDYTAIGTSSYTTIPIEYVTGITFSEPLNQFDVVRIEVGPAAFADMGMYSVPVRTIEDEAAFASAVAAGTQPTYISLTQYELQEQVKSEINQYPLFNVYDVVTGEVVKASPLFAYKESSDAPVNNAVQRRIIVSDTGRDFEFEQYLLDRDDNILYGYRSLTTEQEYWFNPLTNEVQFWNGTSWTNKVLMTTPSGTATRVAVVAKLDPADVYTLEGALWFNTTTNVLYRRTSGVWVAEPNVVINNSDPHLRTVWRHSLTNQEYVPQYVDKDRQPVTVGSPLGDWALVDQWMFNPEHHNKQTITYTQLITHYSSILAAQPSIPGLLGGGVYTLTQDEIDYGLGGTIKEHNDSFDTLISAVNVTNTTPNGVVEFASHQYAAALTTVRELFNKHAPTIASQYSRAALAEASSFVAQSIITEYENNDFAAQVYGDTSAYDVTTGKGVQNWPATTPMFGLATKFQPHLTISGTTVQLLHHDGHRSTIAFTPGEQDRLAKAVCNQPDSRGAMGKLGLIKPTAPPQTETAFISAFGSPMRVGVFWYHLGGGRRQLYKFAAYDIGTLAPSFYDTAGNQIRDGVMYYNTTVDAVFVKQGLAWVQITTTGAGDISPLWITVDFAELLGNVYLEIEQRLFDVTPDLNQAFNYASLLSEPTVYADLYHDRFMQYVAEQEITAPLVNVAYTASNPYTWNYITSPIATPPRIASTPASAGCWQQLYTNCYGTPYPHLEPWKLQGFHDKPLWWDEEYLETVGTRRWIYNHVTQVGMWNNIRLGIIPVGRTNPDGTPATGAPGVAPTYNYFSVNISDVTIVGGYAPDALLPPLYDNSSLTVPFPSSVRSIYVNYSTEVSAPDADYVFGDIGPTEWQWMVSVFYPYDFPIIAFQMQPARMLHYTFGTQYTIVDGLQVETTFDQVYSHEDTLFHGDIYDTNKVYHVRGLNQWYVNLNRYNGFDTNGEFRELWAGWDPHLTYQFAGIVDTSTIEIASKYFDIIDQDYHVLLANDGVIKDLWADSLSVSLLNIPPAIIQYNNQSQWRLEVDTVASITRAINYYGVKSYPFVADVTANEFWMFKYSMLAVNSTARRIIVAGDQTGAFRAGVVVSITQSPSNDGNYTVVSTVFDSTLNQTRINVQEPIPSSSNVGILEISSLAVTWLTGDPVVLSSSKFLPAPLKQNTVYYVIVTGSRTFKLAETQDEAINGVYVDISSVGIGDHTVSQLEASFNIYGGQGNTSELWYHFAIDKTDLRTFTPPFIVNGMQTFINIIDGYSSYQKDTGLLLGVADSNDFDPLTGRLIDWQLETERFMDWAFGMRNTNIQVNDVYPFRIDIQTVTNVNLSAQTVAASNADWTTGVPVRLTSTGTVPAPLVAGLTYYLISTATPGVFQLGTEATPLVPITLTTTGSGVISITSDRLIFTQMQPQWGNGMSVVMTSSNTLPEPIIAESPYHVILTGIPGTIRLSSSSAVDDTSSYIQFSTLGSGTLVLSRTNVQRAFPHFEMNPTRNNVWIDTPLGILSDVIQGPYTDIRVQQTIFDQYNRVLGPDRITVYRQDRRSHIAITPAIPNDVDILSVDDPYNYIHIGGGHFFTEGYEHYLIFNDTTVSGSLIYDPFLGLNTKRFDVDYFEKEDYTLRPTLGGFYLLDNKFYRNIEGAVDDMRNYYDTFELSETSEVARRSRALLGYDGNMPFLDLLNTNKKTQFLFYKGMIQTKGSINSVNAYINSRRFVDAKIDEFWAHKIADFGDARPRLYPRIKLFSTDGIASDARLKFLSPTDDPISQEVKDAVLNGFKLVSFATENRWDAYPQQLAQIKSPLFFDGEVTSVISVYVGTSIPVGANTVVTYFYNTTASKLFAYDMDAGTWTIDVTVDKLAIVPVVDTPSNRTNVYINHNIISDDVRVSRRIPVGTSLTDFSSTVMFTEGTSAGQYVRVNSEVISINQSDFTGIIDIYPINVSIHRVNPAKLLDVKSSTVVSELPIWHPAINQHSHVAIHNVDLQEPSDPARYQVSLNPDPAIQWNVTNSWNNEEIGTTWLDTSYMKYVPYYDTKVFPAINDRLARWGNLTPWGAARVFQWTQSTVPPSQWDATVIAQQNASIPQADKATGTPRLTTFRRQRAQTAVTLNYLTSTVNMSPLTVAAGDQVLFNADALPATGIDQGTKYIVTNVVGTTFQLTNPVTESMVTFSDNGLNVKLTPAFTANNWVKQVLVSDRISGAYAAANARTLASIVTPLNWTGGYTLPVAKIAWKPADATQWTIASAPFGDTVDVYINGTLRDSQTIVTIDVSTGLYVADVTAPFVVDEYDIIDIVRPQHSPTDTELAFDPDVDDDGTQLIQWTQDYEYTMRTITGGATTAAKTPTTYYYFWVENSTSRRAGNSGLSVQEVAAQLTTIPSSHLVLQTPKDDVDRTYPDTYNITADQRYGTPIFYRDAVVREVANYLTDDDRYVIEFNRDLTLRDDITANGRQMNLKNRHEEWVLFRQDQSGTIDRGLWDSLTESMIGYKLSDHTKLVPNPTRTLYDARNNTDTRFGLGDDQAFVDKTLAISTILAYLQDPSKDFTPTDINVFFSRYNFDTPANIEAAMDAIYVSFTSTHVNAMWFQTLNDAFSTKSQYAEIMKTSWVALHGIRVLEVGGLFD